jgi:hypothetical protein
MLSPSVPKWTRFEKTNTPRISDQIHPREAPVRCVFDPILRGGYTTTSFPTFFNHATHPTPVSADNGG